MLLCTCTCCWLVYLVVNRFTERIFWSLPITSSGLRRSVTMVHSGVFLHFHFLLLAWRCSFLLFLDWVFTMIQSGVFLLCPPPFPWILYGAVCVWGAVLLLWDILDLSCLLTQADNRVCVCLSASAWGLLLGCVLISTSPQHKDNYHHTNQHEEKEYKRHGNSYHENRVGATGQTICSWVGIFISCGCLCCWCTSSWKNTCCRHYYCGFCNVGQNSVVCDKIALSL